MLSIYSLLLVCLITIPSHWCENVQVNETVGNSTSTKEMIDISDDKIASVGTIHYEEGGACIRGREGRDYCETWASGEMTIKGRGDILFYNFSTTDHKNCQPILVKGAATALWIKEHKTIKNHFWVSGLLVNELPIYEAQPIEVMEGRPFRMDIRRRNIERRLHYKWVEVTIWGELISKTKNQTVQETTIKNEEL